MKPKRVCISHTNDVTAIDDVAVLQQPADVNQYQDETIQLVKEALMSNREQPSKPSLNPAIQSFWDPGTSIRSRGNAGTQDISFACVISL